MASKADKCEGCKRAIVPVLMNYMYTEADGGFVMFCYSCFTQVYEQMQQEGVTPSPIRQGA